MSETLDPLGLAVVGGRVADVGVSGLVLGGGISFFSGRRGWACDNVLSYEIVLASGQITTASPAKNRDLYWALRGGAGTNFGIVTRFDLAAFPQGDLWWRSLIFPGQLNTTLIPLYQNLTVSGLPTDLDAHTYLVTTFIPQLGGFVVLNDQFHSSPGPGAETAVPEVFQPLDPVPKILNTTTIANISTISRAIDSPYGSQQIWMNTAVSARDPQLLLEVVPLWESYANGLIQSANGTALTPYLVFQPLSVNILDAMQTNGGNALGLSSTNDGPLMIVQLSVTWSDLALNGEVEKQTKNLVESVKSLAKNKGLGNEFIYMNYAEPSQDVLGGYGRENLERLRRVSRRYDPRGELKRLWRGYFKL